MSGLYPPGEALALPIGFGVNQGALQYSEIRNDDFIVYHDERAPAEGRMTINSLNAAKPHLEAWLDVGRTRPLPVVMSAVTENASFANFITDAVELQTMGQGTRDLYWHEYVHSTMYRHLDNWFGPAGSIIHLPWMPAWFIEGLAEALSVSVGSDVQAGIERYQSLNGEWPSYDRLHSLYGKNSFALRGYATAGAFVAWMLRKTEGKHLPDLLRDFYQYSMPWWWPWAAVPFNNFMPMDESLRRFAGENGERLYEQYKSDATRHWKNLIKTQKSLAMFGQQAGTRHYFANASSMYAQGNDLYLGVRRDGNFLNATMVFDTESGWATGWKEKEILHEDLQSWARVITPDLRATVIGEKPGAGPAISKIIVERPRQKRPRMIHRGEAYISGLWRHGDEVLWLETAQEITRLCFVDTNASKKFAEPECGDFGLPVSLEFLGSRTDNKHGSSELWFNLREQTVVGDRHEIGIYDTATHKWRKFKMDMGGQPISVAFAGKEIWMLAAGRSLRTLRHLDENGRCVAEQGVGDFPLRVFGLQSGDIVLALYGKGSTVVRRLPRGNMRPTTCQPLNDHASPILAAVIARNSRQPDPDLKSALTASDTWNPDATPDATPNVTSNREPTATATAAVPTSASPIPVGPLDQDAGAGILVPSRVAKQAAWRGRPVLAFPWIGADDALGPQIGAVSVPLMDHMQNETVRFTALYGIYSRYPNTELSLVSNRFTPTLSLTGFRHQTYNGQFVRRADSEIVSSYLDERGSRIEVSQLLQWSTTSLFVEGGWKYSKLTPYLGPSSVRQGYLSEPYLNLTHSWNFTGATWNNALSGRAAPPRLNKEFDYNVLGAQSTLRVPLSLLSSRLDLGVEGSRTRGPKRRELQELYRPLKTFVAGTGGGYNQNSFQLYGDGELFSARFANTQGRAKLNWTFPLIADVDKLLWILYVDRLDFTAFVNYGGAWRGDGGALPKSAQLVGAQGYNLDLSLDNKGVRFNAGLGTGQVFKTPWQIYGTFGFDALF